MFKTNIKRVTDVEKNFLEAEMENDYSRIVKKKRVRWGSSDLREQEKKNHCHAPSATLNLVKIGTLFILIISYSLSSAVHTFGSSGGVTIPQQYDEWCTENQCFSIETCLEQFQNNYVDLQIQTSHSIRDGPGQHLIYDGAFMGETISRQSFVTQFVLDITKTTLGISPCKVHVLDILTVGGDFKNLRISFRLFNAVHEEIHELTRQVQNRNSLFYTGKVTSGTDQMIGLVIPKWDFSIRLHYAIGMIGKNDIKNINGELVLNQGSERWCKDNGMDDAVILSSYYCEFERLIEQDLVRSFSSNRTTTIDIGQVVILFVKPSGMDGIIVTCRFMPPVSIPSTRKWLEDRLNLLVTMIHNQNDSSVLYNGNVTFRLDPSWGVSKQAVTPRITSKRLNRSVRQTPKNEYLRCKDTQRCGRGWSYYNQSSSDIVFTMQFFSGGEHKPIPLFADFEDWRMGTLGWDKVKCGNMDNSESSKCNIQLKPVNTGNYQNELKRPNGAHWSPFDFESLGPSIPSFNTSTNSGLVLNAHRLSDQVQRQEDWVYEIDAYLSWLNTEINMTSLEAHTRFRKDIQSEITRTLSDYEKLLMQEKNKKSILESSQCAITESCTLVFNTSDLQLTGIINATGNISTTPDGTEVALWTFDSIDIGKEVSVEVTGQRALALLSKSSIFINTNFTVKPGTLGGFPGGYSVSRIDRLNSICEGNSRREPFVCDGDYPLKQLHQQTISNNINGPGSRSVRVYSYTIETSAVIVHEVQSLKTDAIKGQVINGGFKLHFNGYSTPFIPHDVSARDLQLVMEDSLNAAKLNALSNIDRTDIVPGLGKLRVSRYNNGSSGGYEWKITFLTAVGNIGEEDSSPLTATNFLNGIGASISIDTLVNGNTIGGNFTISFLGNETRPLQHDITAEEMKSIILEDIHALSNADVIRSGKLGTKCYDGLCTDGPHQTDGYLWSLILETDMDNNSPSSPTSKASNLEKQFANLTVKNNLNGCVASHCPSIMVLMDHEKFITDSGTRRPFSISSGGAGAGYGGDGGIGFGANIGGSTYGDIKMTNLLGGSGGSLGVSSPFDTLILGMEGRLRGGSGGGAIEIIALNEITIGSNAVISCNGEDGWSGYAAGGGGGSGGSILLSANGNINVKGTIEAKGGDGGIPLSGDEKYIAGGGGGGRIALYGKSISDIKYDVSGGKCGKRSRRDVCSGKTGSVHRQNLFTHTIFLDDQNGAAGTNNSLCFKAQSDNHYWLDPRNQYQHEGPEFVFSSNSRPGRISYFIKFDSDDNQAPVKGWELTTALKSKATNLTDGTATPALCLTLGEKSKHGISMIGQKDKIYFKRNMNEFKVQVKFNHWYHVDIRIDWKLRTYHIYIDNSLLVEDATLTIESVESFATFISLSNVDIWLDEVFVGDDSSMNFRCPVTLHDGSIKGTGNYVQNDKRGWKESEIGSPSLHGSMKHHESHLSKRKVYKRTDNGGLVPFDGQRHISYSSDVKSRKERYRNEYLTFDSVMFSHCFNTEKDASCKTSYFWYNEHYNADLERDGFVMDKLSGGVAACSTTDFISWKNEGIMLHYANLTDMVSGISEKLHVERPFVLFNHKTKKFVMWMIIDNPNQTLAMAGVATSDYPTGPFTFVRSFYPDGNRTRDQTVYQDDDGVAYLVRTYYDTIEYTLPAAVVQPIWETVKNKDGSTNFPLTYHRAHYEPDYDNFHDIYLQRWRGEDKPWKVVCVNRETKVEREIPYGREGIDLCDNRLEYKRVIGQGSPLYDSTTTGVKSRFLDPNNEENTYWKPDSVPSVQAQSWKANFLDGSCGKYLIGDDIEQYDPNLPHHEIPNRRNCSNIADNPVHSTVPDKRIGAEEVIQRRRTKFIAISQLTEDYLDTTGLLRSFEGELENGADISSLVADAKKHLIPDVSYSIQGAYSEPIHLKAEEEQSKEWDRNYHQYEKNYNDRSLYSLACILDGKCPTDFRDNIN